MGNASFVSRKEILSRVSVNIINRNVQTQRNNFKMTVVIYTHMGKNRDLLKVLLLILIGMFIPFFGSIALSYGFLPAKILVAFLYFLVIFSCELGCVYLYFSLSGRQINRKIEQYKPK